MKGDTKSLSIAAASILAKTARDARMQRLDDQYPGYGFAKHKGYPVREHSAPWTDLVPARSTAARSRPCARSRLAATTALAETGRAFQARRRIDGKDQPGMKREDLTFQAGFRVSVGNDRSQGA